MTCICDPVDMSVWMGELMLAASVCIASRAPRLKLPSSTSSPPITRIDAVVRENSTVGTAPSSAVALTSCDCAET